MIALCADVEVAEQKGVVAVVEDVMLEIADVDVGGSGCHVDGTAGAQGLPW